MSVQPPKEQPAAAPEVQQQTAQEIYDDSPEAYLARRDAWISSMESGT